MFILYLGIDKGYKLEIARRIKYTVWNVIIG